MLYWKKYTSILFIGALLVGCASGRGASGFAVRSAALDHGVLSAQLDWQPDAALLDALDHGIALPFAITLETDEPGWLPWRAAAQAHWHRELRYFPLTREYRLRDPDDASGAGAQPLSYSARAASIAALADLRLPLPAGFPSPRAQCCRLRIELERERLPGALRLPALIDAGLAPVHGNLRMAGSIQRPMTRRLSRVVRRLLPALAIAVLLAAALLFARDAAGGSSRLDAYYTLILAASAAALGVLVLVIVQRLMRLSRELREQVAGARLTRRMLLMLVGLAVPPVLIVYGFALFFLLATIDSWFSVHTEQSLGDALRIGQAYLDERLRVTGQNTVRLADELGGATDAELQTRLDAVIVAQGATQLTVFGDDRGVLATSSSDPRFLDPSYPDGAMLTQMRDTGRYAAAERMGGEGSLTLHVLIPLGDVAPGHERILQALYPVPAEVQPLMASVEQAQFDYGGLKFLRDSLKLTFALVLTFVLLLSALFAVLTAFGVARRLTAPIGRLALATRAVGAGRYDTPLPIASDDELGFLTSSFIQMQSELELASARAAQSAQETDSQRAYLKAVLERLSAGVLGLDDAGVLRTANHAAETILDVPLSRYVGQHLFAVRRDKPVLAPLIDAILKHVDEEAREWREEVVLGADEGPSGERRVLMLRGAELGSALGGEAGVVAVFDDLTQLNSAQRDAAWAEVARRLAHEVKNPLTPIQLAAERLRRRFLGRLPPEETEILDRATYTIVNQVEALKAMVNAFGDYARPPQIEVRPLSINALAAEVLDLYENDQRIQLTRQFAPADPLLRADAVRLRQLLHNLIKNSLEAVSGERKPHIEVTTREIDDGGRHWVELTVADNGPGLPENFDERWFEPYTTSKVKGTGLGLAVAKKIAEEHGGNIRAESRPSGGAAFTLRLPREVA